MIDSAWFGIDLSSAVHVALSTVAVYLCLILLVRWNGLRTFAKMSSFDFAMTIAMGSIMATTITSRNPSVLQGCLGFLCLIFLQRVVGRLRFSKTFEATVDNRPLMLMKGTTILHDNLKEARVTESDLRAKLREANVIRLSQVRAVVLETTGDISVLHADGDTELEDYLLEGTRE